MSERIEVGDLVVIVRWPCCDSAIGEIGTVSEFRNSRMDCSDCKQEIGAIHFAVIVYGDGTNDYVPPEWLRKIPPLGELEGVETKEVIHA